MQGKSLYTILLSIIAVMALALAVMIVFLFTAFRSTPADPSQETKPPLKERAVPIDEQVEFTLYSTGEIFSIKSTEEHPNSFIKTSVSIIYDGGKKNKKLEERKELIEKNVTKLKNATVKYFMSQGLEDLQKGNQTIELSEAALKNAYNEIVSVESEDMIIIDVIIMEWIVQEL